MYLKRLLEVNVGPIEKVEINAEFNEEKNPKPIVLVGENGSGKSTVMSNVVDSFYEIAGEYYGNVCALNESDIPIFYKILDENQRHNGEKYCFSYIQYDNEIEYVYKVGELTNEEFNRISSSHTKFDKWDNKGGIKDKNAVTLSKTKEAFSHSVICFMGPNRYEKPDWMPDAYFENPVREKAIIKNKPTLCNSISMMNLGQNINQWINNIVIDPESIKTKENVELILSKILGTKVLFSFESSNDGDPRLHIKKKEDGIEAICSLDSLSTGQLSLFNMFATIIQYAYNNDQLELKEISGIVLIEEIELHIHTTMQKEIIPELLHLFPKVQFIISTHSPVFLLGMDDVYEVQGYNIYELPGGNSIGTEIFSEFQNAYSYFVETQKYRADINERIRRLKDQIQGSHKPLLLTEGKTDATILNCAWTKLYKDTPCPFDIKSCSLVEDEEVAGCDVLGTILKGVRFDSERIIIGLFDNDKAGKRAYRLDKNYCMSNDGLYKENTSKRG